jgi:hypothetical protein
MRFACAVVSYAFLTISMGWCASPESEDLAQQLKRTQEQMRVLADKIESQQQKIEEQAAAITNLKGENRPIAGGLAARALDQQEGKPVEPARKTEGERMLSLNCRR